MIIFINGSINSGKSTVAKILVDKLGNTALLEIDYLRDFISWMPLKESIPINLENAVAIIKIFMKKGMSTVVPYPLSKENYQYFIENLKEHKDRMHIFTLSPKLEKVLTNRGARELSEWEKERIKYHYAVGIPSPDFGVIIDNTNQSPNETAEQILSVIRKTTEK